MDYYATIEQMSLYQADEYFRVFAQSSTKEGLGSLYEPITYLCNVVYWKICGPHVCLKFSLSVLWSGRLMFDANIQHKFGNNKGELVLTLLYRIEFFVYFVYVSFEKMIQSEDTGSL